LDRRRPQAKEQALDSHDPSSYKPPLKPLPPIRNRHSHQLEAQSRDELLQISRDAPAPLLGRATCSRLNDRITSSDIVDLSAEVGDLVTELFWKSWISFFLGDILRKFAVACHSVYKKYLHIEMSTIFKLKMEKFTYVLKWKYIQNYYYDFYRLPSCRNMFRFGEWILSPPSRGTYSVGNTR
jgi:hypothetical protein